MKRLVGKNDSFCVVWNCSKQTYTVYKDNRYLITGHRYRDIKSYLD